jgi:lysophospholipid acyltransferase (LPLAT)-like uncharacterized protein
MIGQTRSTTVGEASGRNLWTRVVDAAFAAVRSYAPPLHWFFGAVSAAVLFMYVRLVAATSRLKTSGEGRWPNLPAPCVVALWHQSAPSLLVAFTKRRPRSRAAIMISRDPRGDMLAMLCRMVGFAVVRSGASGGWKALAELSRELAQGACVFITADGDGPARIAKVGAVALASAAGVPLVPLAVDCAPAIEERHKWDSARNPIPFGSISVSFGPSRTFARSTDLEVIEQARRWLEEMLNAPPVKDA